jgi:chemotaxis protein histidine kinase CheA
MEDRVGALGGELHLESQPGTGTTVTLQVPTTDLAIIGVGAPATHQRTAKGS